MFRIIKYDFETLPRERLITKYSLYAIIISLIFMLLGPLIAQLFTINQFSKVTGRIVSKNMEITSRGRNSHKQATYYHSLVVLLDNNQSYNIDLDDNDWEKYAILHKGDSITFYNPTTIYRILSLDFLFTNKVSQVEFKNKVLYGFNQHKHIAWDLMGLIVIALIPFSYFLYDYYNYK